MSYWFLICIKTEARRCRVKKIFYTVYGHCQIIIRWLPQNLYNNGIRHLFIWRPPDNYPPYNFLAVAKLFLATSTAIQIMWRLQDTYFVAAMWKLDNWFVCACAWCEHCYWELLEFYNSRCCCQTQRFSLKRHWCFTSLRLTRSLSLKENCYPVKWIKFCVEWIYSPRDIGLLLENWNIADSLNGIIILIQTINQKSVQFQMICLIFWLL